MAGLWLATIDWHKPTHATLLASLFAKYLDENQ
jgi:hypothetical protein